MRCTIVLDQEEDARWIAEILEIPGCLVYAETQPEAVAAVQALALRVLADRIDHGELVPSPTPVTFYQSA